MAATWYRPWYYSDVIMGAMASQITGVSIVCLTVCSGADQRKHQSSASLAFVRVYFPHKGPVTRKMFPLNSIRITISKTCIACPLWGESTGHRWIPINDGAPHQGPEIRKTFTWRLMLCSRFSSNGNIFRVTGPLWGEFTGQRRKGTKFDQKQQNRHKTKLRVQMQCMVYIIFKLASWIYILSSSWETSLLGMLQNLTDNYSKWFM